MNSSRFSGRVAVIAGGASGAGRAVAKRISAEGGLVAIWDNNQAAISALEQEFRPAMTLKVDVTDPAA